MPYEAGRPTVDNVVAFYAPGAAKVTKGTPVDVIEKRVHSKGYHNLRTYLRDSTSLQKAHVDERASRFFGVECKERWKSLYGGHIF